MKTGIAGKLAKLFIDSKLTPLLIISALMIGAFATWLTPREEEPQISVPMVDILVPYAGGSSKVVEDRIARPLEQVVSEIKGVEYVYSMSTPDFALVTVRYYVGEDTENSLVKLWSTLLKNIDRLPTGMAMMPLVKLVSIDDVPILTLTLWGEEYDGYLLRRIAAELSAEIKKVPDVAEAKLSGGFKRKIRIQLDQDRLREYRIDPLQLSQQIKMANQEVTAGSYQQGNRDFLVETGAFFQTVQDIENLIIGIHNGSPVYLRNVAEVIDGPEEINNYVFHGHGAASGNNNGEVYPAVTVSIAKRPGADAKSVADRILQKIETLKGELIPGDLAIEETRNYGDTASEKVNTLLEHLLGAIIAVTIIVGFFLGWRGGLVVFASVPITFALTLFVYYLFGYTLNRVTLFALIFVTGIVVDDSIIIAENLHRHFSMRRLPKLQAALAAINEVGNPTILATFTVIASVLPMVFVSGLMGPYMSPMPIGASLAMLFSLFVALIATPWLAYRLLKQHGKVQSTTRLEDTHIYRFYRRLLQPMMENVGRIRIALGVIAMLLLLAVVMLFIRAVEVKMLPFDNKSEIQIIVDLPEGSTLENTASVAHALSSELASLPELQSYQYYVGTHAPINFNGLVRHYYLREQANMADIQLNLVHKSARDDQSHAIAKRIRTIIQPLAQQLGARIKVAEVPPGPPVLATLVAEVYGPDLDEQIEAADKIRRIFESSDGVVDPDWMVEDDQIVQKFRVDHKKAALAGVSAEQIAHSIRLALAGSVVTVLKEENELEEVSVELRLAEKQRTSLAQLKRLAVQSPGGAMVSVGELVTTEEMVRDKTIYRKNQKRVVYVTADVAGQIESPIYAMLNMDPQIAEVAGEPIYGSAAPGEERINVKWDGEWQITFEVFRDLGAAFAVVIVVIYLLIIGWFQSFKTPLVMMVAIPLSLVGIIPGHWVHGAFFTATSMIGMIALAGIMVRNSILIIDFIELRRADGIELKQAVIEAGAVRTRPILLTAGTVVIGAIVILFDPIFEGLAIALMWGAASSTVLTLLAVPLIYYMVERSSESGESPADDGKAKPEAGKSK